MKNRFLQYMVLLGTLTISSISSAQNCQDNWLSTEGNKIVDINGKEVTLAGVNWFGFETNAGFPHGIGWTRSMKGVLEQIKDLGFNCLRIPWSNATMYRSKTLNIAAWMTDPYTGNGPMDNQEESEASTPLELLDLLVEWCQENDMKIILDNHSREDDAYLVEKLWFTPEVTTEQWIEDWVDLATRYKDYSAVIGMDLNNEPNGKIDNAEGAKWGTGDQYDWRLAAEDCGNAILEVNPNVLILVEGIEAYNKPDGTETSYWWGGNLQGARDYPIRLNDPSKLVYSPHEYGPRVFAQEWFVADDFPENMEGIWEEQFNFLNKPTGSPLLIGELGIQSEGGLDEIWFTEFIEFIKKEKLHYTFWAFNPNSGDTGGIVADDWLTVVQWKMDYLEDILSEPIPNCIAQTDTVLSNEEFNAEVVDFSVYPNPTVDLVTFSTSSNNIESIQLFDLNGREVQAVASIASTSAYEFDLSNLANGMYLAKVISEKGVSITVKVVKK